MAKGRSSEILSAPLVPLLLRLSGPVLVSMSLHTLWNVVNAAWVGRLGKEPLAAVTTAMFATWMLAGAAEMLGAGLLALVARHWGAGDRAGAVRVAGESLTFGMVLAVLVALSASWTGPLLFDLVETAPGVKQAGAPYLTILLYGSILFFPLVALESVLRASGDTRTPMQVSVVVLVANLLLDPLLIFGWGPVPALGVPGAAIATVLSQAMGVALLLSIFARRDPFPRMFRALGRFRWVTVGRLVRVGGPPMLGTLLFSLVYLVLSRQAARLGTAELAVLGVGNRLESLCFLTANALSIAAATVVGQNLGAADPARAKEAATRAAWIGLWLGAAFGLLFYFAADGMFSIFGADPDVRARGAPYLRVLALAQAAMGFEIILFGAFGGAGYTRAPSAISIAVSLARLPLAEAWAFHWGGGAGILGIAWVLTLTCVLRALLLYGLFRRGRWLQTVV